MVDSVITLYEQNETSFTSNGLGSLHGASSCEVYEERNGEFELTMSYPVFGRHFADLKHRRIIFCKPNPHSKHQPFRIYSITKPINGIVDIYARHIHYDLSGYPITAFTATGLSGIFAGMNSQMTKPWNANKKAFKFLHDKPDTAQSEFDLVAPCSALALLGGSDGTILDRFHGEYEWDKWNVILHESRGEDRGVVIAYGKNLTDFEQEESCDRVWTAVYPFWYSEEYGLVELGTSTNTVPCPGSYDHERIYMLDLSGEFEEKPSPDQLKVRTEKFISDNELGSPKVSMTISFVNQSDTTNYGHLKILQTVKLCDTVRVEFPKMKVTSSSKCISTRYNALTDKYIEIQLGDPANDLATTLSSQGADIGERPTKTFVERSIAHQTSVITGNKGGFMVIHDSDGDGKPDEALFMDTDDIATAKKVLRINKSGIGFSYNGYNGPYNTAWTLDGIFNADFITAGTMLANRIKGGILSLGGADNGNGAIYIYNAKGVAIGHIDNTGLYIGPKNQFYVDLEGKMYAETGTFLGNVYAKNISAGGSAGYVSGSQIGSKTVGNGNMNDDSINNRCIQSGSVYDSTIASGAGISKGKLSAEVQNLLADVITANNIFSGSATANLIVVNKLVSPAIQFDGYNVKRTFIQFLDHDGNPTRSNILSW